MTRTTFSHSSSEQILKQNNISILGECFLSFVQNIFLSLKHKFIDVKCIRCIEKSSHLLPIKPKIDDFLSTCIQIEKSGSISDFMRSSMTSLLGHNIAHQTEYEVLLTKCESNSLLMGLNFS